MVEPWKVLVYIAADNSLYNDAQASLQEIVTASRLGDIETIVQVDGPSTELSSRYICRGGSKELVWEAPDGYTDDRKSRLADFLKSTVDPAGEAKKVFLVLWGHGAGLDHVYFYKNSTDNGVDAGTSSATAAPVASSSNLSQGAITSPGPAFQFTALDVLNGGNANRYVSDVALAEVLANYSQLIGRKIDLLGFDACMMSMAEIWHELRDSTAVAVASDLEIPLGSWPYAAILGDLAKHPCAEAKTLSAIVVNRFLEKYSAIEKGSSVSLTAVDLSGCDALAKAVTALVQELTAVASDGAMRRKVFRARDSSRTADEVTYIDLATFCRELCESFSSKSYVYLCSRKILDVLTLYPYVIYHRDAEESASAYGVALYFPEMLAPTANALQSVAAQNSLTVGTKFPPSPGKFPPSAGKFPPGTQKFPGSSGDSDSDVQGYEILWDHYLELEFSRATGWAGLIEELLRRGY
jgi:hypothetical protein